MKNLVRFCWIWFALSLCFAPAAAGLNVGTPFQDGSLLIFPKIEVSEGHDTIIRIGNSDCYQPANLMCYWETDNATHQSFPLLVFGYAGAEFRASNGEAVEPGLANYYTVPRFPGSKGSLTCWALDYNGTQQISFNYLHGSAAIYNFKSSTALEYKSWNFRALGVSKNQPVGTPGKIMLTGKNKGYDACPGRLSFVFGASGGSTDNNSNQKIEYDRMELTLLPCKRDLRDEGRASVSTKAIFRILNAYGISFPGAYTCVTDYLAGYLDNITYDAKLFTHQSLKTNYGYFTVEGMKSTVCKGAQTTAFLGMLTDFTKLSGKEAVKLTLPEQIGSSSTGIIWWTPPTPVLVK